MSEHRHFDAATGEEIFTLVSGCFRCELARDEADRHAEEYIEELENALRQITGLPESASVIVAQQIAIEILHQR